MHFVWTLVDYTARIRPMRSRAVKNFIFLDDLVLSIAEYFYESHSLFDNPLVHVHVKLHVYLVSLLIHCINMIFFNR